MKKIIITGAAGLVGMNLLSEIDTSKYEVIALDKNKDNLEIVKKLFPKIKTICADLSDKGKWEKNFEGTDCVVQLQAQISSPGEQDYYDNNVKSVKNVVDVCEKYKIKNLIHVSSSVVISKSNDIYVKTKKQGEEIIKKSKLNYTILRPPIMYGCFNIKHFSFIVKKFENWPFVLIPGKGNYIRQPLFVKDLVKIILKLIERKPKNKAYNIIGKEKIYFIDLLKKMFREKNQKKIFIKLPMHVFLILLKVHGFLTGKKPFVASQLNALTAGDIFPLENWEKEFNVKYTPFKKGIKEMIDSKYYKYNKMLSSKH